MMSAYKNEIVEMPTKLMRLINEQKVSELERMFNERIVEGWELVSHTYLTSGGGGQTRCLYITLKESSSAIKYKCDLVEMPLKFTTYLPEKKAAELSESFEVRLSEGWQLVAHTYLSASGVQEPAMIVTFKKDTE